MHVHALTLSIESQLATDDCGVCITETVVTDSAPGIVETHLQPTLSHVGAIL